jgi:hypothetical protein
MFAPALSVIVVAAPTQRRLLGFTLAAPPAEREIATWQFIWLLQVRMITTDGEREEDGIARLLDAWLREHGTRPLRQRVDSLAIAIAVMSLVAGTRGAVMPGDRKHTLRPLHPCLLLCATSNDANLQRSPARRATLAPKNLCDGA